MVINHLQDDPPSTTQMSPSNQETDRFISSNPVCFDRIITSDGRRMSLQITLQGSTNMGSLQKFHIFPGKYHQKTTWKNIGIRTFFGILLTDNSLADHGWQGKLDGNDQRLGSQGNMA